MIAKNGRDEFAAAVVEALKAAHFDKSIAYDPETFCVQIDGTKCLLYLGELYKEYSLMPPASRPDLIRQVVAARRVRSSGQEKDSWRYRQFPEYVPQGWELEDTAREMLERCFVDGAHGLVSGNYSGSHIGHCYNKYEEIVGILGNDARRKIVDEVEEKVKGRFGDSWEAYKFTFRPGYFSSPADPEAILRLANDIPEGMWEEAADHYSSGYVSVLCQVKDAFLRGLPELPTHDWRWDLEEEDVVGEDRDITEGE